MKLAEGGVVIPQDKKERLVELRAGGMSYEAIAKEIEISKQTAITWSREMKNQIQNAKAIRMDALMQKLQIGCEQRLTSFAALQKRLTQEIENRDLSTLSTKELCEMLLKTAKTLKEEQVPIEFAADDSAMKIDFTTTATWTA